MAKVLLHQNCPNSNAQNPFREFISLFPSPPFIQLYHHLDELEEVSL